MHRTLIVARLEPGRSHEVARVFADSDQTELPHLVGVSARSLFTFHDLYLHLIESDRDPTPGLREVRDHPLFTDVNTKLSRYVTAYSPDWREPKDAMAREFYHWSSEGSRR
jgi:cyclase